MAGAACRGPATFGQHALELVIKRPLHQRITCFNVNFMTGIISIDVNDNRHIGS